MPSPPPPSISKLFEKIKNLEDALQKERVARKEEMRLRQRELKDEVLAREKEIRIIREALAPFYRSEEEIKRKMIELEDQVEGNYDDHIGLLHRVIALDDATDRLEQNLAILEGSSKARPSNGDSPPKHDKSRSSKNSVARKEQPPTNGGTETARKLDFDSPIPNSPESMKLPFRPNSPELSDAASSIDPSETAVSRRVSPILTPSLARPGSEEYHPRSSGILDLSLPTKTVGTPPDASYRSVASPIVDFAPSPRTMTAFVRGFPKFTSALAPYEPPQEGRARRFSEGSHLYSRTSHPHSVDIVAALLKRPGSRVELLGGKIPTEGRKRKRRIDDEGLVESSYV
ncbi:MAG: hypothetical protein Q9160_007233 [Pyrenula sp. 1 TL-2023]